MSDGCLYWGGDVLTWGGEHLSWGPCVDVVVPEPTVGGGSYVTAEELDRIRRYWRDLEEAQEAPRKARKALERRLGETIKRAYARASDLDDGADEVFAPVLAIKKPNLPRRVAPDDIAPSVDWTAAARQLDLVAQLIAGLEARIADVDARAAEALWIARDEEEIEMILLASEF